MPVAVPRTRRWFLLLLAAGLGLRLIDLTGPLIDHQAWRQTDTAAIARNYYEEGFAFFHPRVDWRGTTPGYVEMNLPLFPYMVAGLYAVAGGAHEWLGRGLAALFSTAAAVPLYWLARQWLGSEAGGRLAAALYLILPMSVFFGRAFMPEAMMLLLSAATLAAFARSRAGPASRLGLAAATAAACFAVKIPTLYLGFPLVALAVERWGWGFVRRGSLWLYLAAAITPAVAWYAHAAGLFEQTGLTFGIWNRHGYDKWDHTLLWQPAFHLLLGRRFLEVVFTPAGAVLLLAGFVALWPRPGRVTPWALHAWLGGLVLYVLLIPEGNRRLHYYQLPFVLPAAVYMAAPLAGLWDRRHDIGRSRLGAWLARLGPGSVRARSAALALVAAVAVGSLVQAGAYYRPAYNIYNYYRSCHAAGQVLDRRLPADALLVIGDVDKNAGASHRSQSPTLLYYCHRKGWQITPDQFEIATLDSLAALGADYFVVAAGFVPRGQPFWRHLLARGVTSAAAFPDFQTDEAAFRAQSRQATGPERHILVARLVDIHQGGN